MFQLLHTIQTWLRARYEAEDGATAIEYGLIAALISVVIIGAVTAVGGALDSVFSAVSGALGGALP